MKTKFRLLAILMALLLLLGGCAAPRLMDQDAAVLAPPEQGSGATGLKDQDSAGLGSAASQAQLLRVHFIDVGQGDSILVQGPAGQNLLVDGGSNEQEEKIIAYLRSQGVEKLAAVVGTHPHEDHIGGLDGVIKSFAVEKVYLPRVTHTTRTFRDLLTAIKNKNLKISTARAGVEIPFGEISCYFLAPVGDNYEGLNNYSAILKLEYGSHSFLLTGDAEKESEEGMLAVGADLKSSVLKVGHHGSSSSCGKDFLQAVSPDYAIISLGRDNPYGHPHRETMEKLARAGVKVLRTDQAGTIIFTSDGKELFY